MRYKGIQKNQESSQGMGFGSDRTLLKKGDTSTNRSISTQQISQTNSKQYLPLVDFIVQDALRLNHHFGIGRISGIIG